MRAVKRTDCFEACIASIGEVTIADVPHTPGPRSRRDAMRAAASIGRLLSVVENRPAVKPKGYHVAVGKTPSGSWHACVALNGSIVHDPSRDNVGLRKIEYWYLLTPVVKDD
jgi:hypothetical protein